MPTVLRIDGLRVVIYLNDHPPAHVHVLGPGSVVVVNLTRGEIRELIGCDEQDARRVLRLGTNCWRHGDGSMAELTGEEFAAAKARGEARMRGPRAESAEYDAVRDRIVVRLTTGAELAFAPGDVQGLQHASPDDLAAIEVESLGLGLHFPKLDADLYVPALLEGIFGSRSWMAARLGATGGRTRSAAKAAASRENGKRGGRPAKR